MSFNNVPLAMSLKSLWRPFAHRGRYPVISPWKNAQSTRLSGFSVNFKSNFSTVRPRREDEKNDGLAPSRHSPATDLQEPENENMEEEESTTSKSSKMAVYARLPDDIVVTKAEFSALRKTMSDPIRENRKRLRKIKKIIHASFPENAFIKELKILTDLEEQLEALGTERKSIWARVCMRAIHEFQVQLRKSRPDVYAEYKRQMDNALRRKGKETNRYPCSVCGTSYSNSTLYKRHLESQKHKRNAGHDIAFRPKRPNSQRQPTICGICEYPGQLVFEDRRSFREHLESSEHKDHELRRHEDDKPKDKPKDSLRLNVPRQRDVIGYLLGTDVSTHTGTDTYSNSQPFGRRTSGEALTPRERHKVVGLRIAGMSIAEIREKFGAGSTTIYNVMQQWRQHGTVEKYSPTVSEKMPKEGGLRSDLD